MITVVLADDHDIVRTGLKCILQGDPEIEVVGEAGDGATAVMLAAKLKPNVLFMDLSMPPFQSGLTAIPEVASKAPDTKVIVFTMFSDLDYVRHAMSHGAWGYLVKNADANEILEAVHTVYNCEQYIYSGLKKQLEKSTAQNDNEDNGKNLTSRELEILRLLAAGYTNREISDTLYLSVKTIEAHRAKLYSKMGFHSRAELVDYALKRGLLSGSNLGQ